MTMNLKRLFLPICLVGVTLFASAQETMKPEDTEVWQPVPVVIDASVGRAPSDALILFDGKNLDQWESLKRPGEKADWPVHDGVFTVNKAAGDIRTRQEFTDYQLHLEYRIPTDIEGEGQARGNSGIYLAATPSGQGYEIQILDSYQNKTYSNGQVGAIYKQIIPLANPARKPGEWQVYDIVWKAPRFNADGSLKEAARVTAFLNGVLLHHDVKLSGETLYIGKPAYHAHGPLPIKLQAHGDKSKPISFRNIWVRPLIANL